MRQDRKMPRPAVILCSKTFAQHGVSCVLWGMLPGIFNQMQNQMHVHSLCAQILLRAGGG
jgi:hypothetical protein